MLIDAFGAQALENADQIMDAADRVIARSVLGINQYALLDRVIEPHLGWSINLVVTAIAGGVHLRVPGYVVDGGTPDEQALLGSLGEGMMGHIQRYTAYEVNFGKGTMQQVIDGKPPVNLSGEQIEAVLAKCLRSQDCIYA